MAYASASDVSNHSRNILGNSGSFDASTSPTLTAVNYWLSSGCAIINTKLASCRYSVPAAAGTVIYDWLSELNAIYAAAHVEMSRTNVTLSSDERTRGQVFLEMFNDQLDMLCDMDLTGAGLSRVSQGKLYTGGIYTSEKQRIESDTSFVKPRFSRGMNRFPGTIDPQGSTASRNE